MKIQIKKIVGVLLACAGIMTSTSCADFEIKTRIFLTKTWSRKTVCLTVPICRI